MEIMKHCPVIDELGHELIEAYRHTEKNAALSRRAFHPEIVHIQQLLTDHRLICPICQHNRAFREKAIQMAVTFFN